MCRALWWVEQKKNFNYFSPDFAKMAIFLASNFFSKFFAKKNFRTWFIEIFFYSIFFSTFFFINLLKVIISHSLSHAYECGLFN